MKLTLIFFILTLFQLTAQEYPYTKFNVRLNHNLLEADAINNLHLQRGKLEDFLSDRGKVTANSLNDSLLDFSKLNVKKLFSDFTTFDTISISRTGDRIRIPPFWATFSVEKPKEISYTKFIERMLAAYPLVIYIDPPMEAILLDVPSDSLFVFQTSLLNDTLPNADIDILGAWNIETGKPHIKVAVFDSGVDSSHIDLDLVAGRAYHLATEDDEENYPWSVDNNGHGTSVAGIIGAKRNNVTGISGIAGGDGSDTSGVSLFDFRWFVQDGDFDHTDADRLSVGLINAARSPGTYYDWSSVQQGYYDYEHAPGFGIHIANHSYYTIIAEPRGSVNDITPPDTSGFPPPAQLYECHLCIESYLFALKNGLINVVSRGNGQQNSGDNPDNPYLYFGSDHFPQKLHDSWIISVGATGTDGERLVFPHNTNSGENWWSPIGANLDILAPGSSANIVSLKSPSSTDATGNNEYRYFNGTSASAPHVSGVAALLLSYYNQPCYSNDNLDPADVEYILQKSADNLNVPGYDDTTGWGRLNAERALQMIQLPEYQILHPTEDPVAITEVDVDTVSFFLDDPIYPDFNGPIGFEFPLTINNYYYVERHKYRLTYDFSNYLTPPLSSDASELLDVWVRHSQTNSLGITQDTSMYWNGNPAQEPILIADTFHIEPFAEIVDTSGNTVTLEGYFYHFIGRYDVPFGSGMIGSNIWYPINPNTDLAKMAFSIYIRDTLATNRIAFGCDSANILLDEHIGLDEVSRDGSDFFVYPNPGTNEIFIKLNNPNAQKEEIRISNLSGETCKIIKINSANGMKIDVSDLENGMYFVTALSPDGSIKTKKWLKVE